MKIKELLSSPDRWTRRANARGIDGSEYSASSPFATSFCLLGAIERCYRNETKQSEVIRTISLELRCLYGAPNVHRWNDEMATFEDVKSLIKKLDI